MRTLKPATDPPVEREDPVSQQKRVKKRIQNRNAQRSFREKQAAYIRTLEKMVNNIAPPSSEASNLQSVQAQSCWVEEIHKLQDALLRMRRRFQSLSLVAASNADDHIFQKILSHQSASRDETARSPAIPQQHTLDPEPGIEPALNLTDATMSDWGQDGDLNTLFSEDYLRDHNTEPGISNSDLESVQQLVVQSGLPVAPSKTPSSLSPSQTPLIEAMRLEDVYNFTDVLGVEKTIKTALGQSNGIDDIDRFISLAVRIMLKHNPLLDGLSSIMGGYGAVEDIIRWRVSPTPANRNKIAPPFRPTVLQQHVVSRHYSIDFLYWAELRDQILLQDDIDICQLVQDCIRHLVQDVPQLNISLPLFETCFHLIQLTQTNIEQRSTSPVELFLDLTDSDDGFQPLYSHCKVFRAVEKYQLDKLARRKLSPKFAEKYPSLDISSFVTHLPVASFG